MAVFLPIVFVEGIAGQLFKDQALTVTISLLASLLVGVTMIPMLSGLGSRLRHRGPRGGEIPPDGGGLELGQDGPRKDLDVAHLDGLDLGERP